MAADRALVDAVNRRGGPADAGTTDGSTGAWGVVARAGTWLALAALAFWAAATVLGLGAIVMTERGVPRWDPAAHGHVSAILADAVRRGDALGFLAGLNRQVTWPFVDSLLRLPAFLVLGDRYESGDLASTALYAGCLAASFLIGLRLHPTRGVPAACMLVVFVLLSPIYRFLGTVSMLEITGAFLLCLTLVFLSRAEHGPRARRYLMAAGIGSAALFLCKYNFGLLWLLPFGIHEAAAAMPDWRARLARGAAGLVRRVSRPRPFTLFVLIYLAVLVGILITGGGEVRVGGLKISLRTPWHLTYYLYIVLLIRLFVAWRRDPDRLLAAWRRVPERLRVLIATVGIPLAVWFLIPYPNRVRAFFRFLMNREGPAAGGALERLAFYPQAFAHEYAPTPWFGFTILALALIPPPPSENRRDLGRLLYLAFWIALVATMMHGYQNSRFFSMAALLAWLRAAHTAAWLVERAFRAAIRHPGIRDAAWGAGLLALVGGGWAIEPDLDRTRSEHRAFESPREFGAVLERVAHEAVQGDRPAVLLGYSNRLSTPLLSWEFTRTRPERFPRWVPERLPWLERGSSEVELQRRIEYLTSRGRRIIAALPTADSPLLDEEYRAEVWADSVVVDRLERAGTLAAESDTMFADVGVRVRSFRAAFGGAAKSR